MCDFSSNSRLYVEANVHMLEAVTRDILYPARPRRRQIWPNSQELYFQGRHDVGCSPFAKEQEATKVPTICFANVGRALEGTDHNQAERHEQEVHDGDVHLAQVLLRCVQHLEAGEEALRSIQPLNTDMPMRWDAWPSPNQGVADISRQGRRHYAGLLLHVTGDLCVDRVKPPCLMLKVQTEVGVHVHLQKQYFLQDCCRHPGLEALWDDIS